jgi:23S rRNA (adenine2503-C2)-methyltransferase
MQQTDDRINLYALSFEELSALLKSWAEPGFRAKQIWHWLYEQRVTKLGAMTNLPQKLRERLATSTMLGTLRLVTEQRSTDGTVKRVYALPDGKLIEAVLMVYEDGRRTACISTQAGCAMGCVFCATGQMGFMRHLSVAEIFEQAMVFARELAEVDERLSNVVLMGMGEPFHNYEGSVGVMHRLMDDLNIGARHITVSTVGLVPQIRQFADEGLQVKLAISLHASDDDARGALLPVNRRWDITELIDACRYYIAKAGRRVTFEWALIHGETDTQKQAQALGRLLQGMLCHVNVIPLNPTAGYNGTPSEIAATDAFIETLANYGVSATVRVRRGIDIDAGCGQLTTKFLNPDDIPLNG